MNIQLNKGKYSIFRLDAYYSQTYLCAITFYINDYGKRESKLLGLCMTSTGYVVKPMIFVSSVRIME